MCGRFAIDEDLNALFAEFAIKGGNVHDLGRAMDQPNIPWLEPGMDEKVRLPRYSIAPTNSIPVAVETTSGGESIRGLAGATWGWERSWSNRPIINATKEKLLSSKTWKPATLRRRTLIPMTGYYEWVQRDETKVPYFVHENQMLAAAGLWEIHDNQMFVTMITGPGTDAAGDVHPRMPMFVNRDLWSDWLNPVELDEISAEHLVSDVASSAGEISAAIETHEVSRQISFLAKLDPDDSSLIAPVR